MIIEALDEDVISQIRSSSAVDSVSQCATELVLNSLDAKATSIAVRINLTTFRVQVVDNGRGISRQNLERTGVRYMSNKCHSLDDLKRNLKYYGFRGEALASISKISQKVTITTKERDREQTFAKIIKGSESTIESVKTRPSFGTTVTVEGLLHHLPVRQRCIKNSELDNIRKGLESLIIIHPRVSFTLRDDSRGKLLLASVKCPDIASSFQTVHPEIDENNFALLKVSKSRISVEGLVHNEFYENKRLQYIYLNKRPINCPKIQNLANSIFQKSIKTADRRRHPVFIIHIRCPYSDVDITSEPTKTSVFFKKIDAVKKCVEKMLSTLWGGAPPPLTRKTGRAASEFGVSQIGGAVRGFGAKRKTDALEEAVANKSAKIDEDTPFFEERKVPSKQIKMALPIEIKKNEKKENGSAANNSLFTNFPDNEQGGKDVLMDMFMMSLKVFPPEDAKKREGNKPESLVRSSISIPEELSVRSPLNKVSVRIQTTSDNMSFPKENMSVGVQTSPNDIHPIVDCDVTFVPRRPLTKFVSDYDFDFSKIDTSAFHFNKLHQEEYKFEQTRKLFDFRNNRNVEFTFCDDQYGLPKNRNNLLELPKYESSLIQLSPEQETCFQSPPKVLQQSSYFSGKSRIQESTRISQNKLFIISKKFNKVTMSYIKRDKQCKSLNESGVSKYFTPKKTEQIKKSSRDDSEDLFRSTKSCEESRHFNNSLENEEVEEDNENVRKMPEDVMGSHITLDQAWMKEVNDFGKIIYTNRKTGLRTLRTPRKDVSFEIADRFDFVPKGMSPILKDYSQVANMTPESKGQLQTALVQSYDDELLLIKWQNYIDNRDPKKFFDEIYLEKSKLKEGSIPSISKSKRAFRGFENMCFAKSLFDRLEIIGQVDCKFIAALDRTKKLLLLFDQHAVHERVRLEQLSDSYKNASTKLDQTVTIFLPHVDLKMIQRHYYHLESLGIRVTFFVHGLRITEVPLCVYNKSRKGADIVSLTQNLIKEIVETLKSNNGILVQTPRVIQNIVNSEACRGAIKFGDVLSRNECAVQLRNLSQCQLPFQCAHGRPTLTPLLLLHSYHDRGSSRPNLAKLKIR